MESEAGAADTGIALDGDKGLPAGESPQVNTAGPRAASTECYAESERD